MEKQQQVSKAVQNLPSPGTLQHTLRLSSSSLLSLTASTPKFLNKLTVHLEQAFSLMQSGHNEHALVYLRQGERMLEYAASCGKGIEKSMILNLLHNEAYCYYKEGDLEKAASYIEGVIYNLKTHGASNTSTPLPANLFSNQAPLSYFPLNLKIELVHYYLKFCTIASQAKMRQTALEASKNIIQTVKCVLDECRTHFEIDLKVKQVMKNVRMIRKQVQIENIGKYRMIAKHMFKKWNESKSNQSLPSSLSNYSIAQVIELQPQQYPSPQTSFPTTPFQFFSQLLHMAMGYFTMGTQYRLMGQKLKGEMWHLMAIVWMAANCLGDMIFMKQLVASYQYHYQGDLTQTNNETEEHSDGYFQAMAEAILFSPSGLPKFKSKPITTKLTQFQKQYQPQNYENEALILTNGQNKNKKSTSSLKEDKIRLKTETGIKLLKPKFKRSQSKVKQDKMVKSLKNERVHINQALLRSTKEPNNRIQQNSLKKSAPSSRKSSTNSLKASKQNVKSFTNEYQLIKNNYLHKRKLTESVSSVSLKATAEEKADFKEEDKLIRSIKKTKKDKITSKDKVKHHQKRKKQEKDQTKLLHKSKEKQSKKKKKVSTKNYYL